MSPTAATVTPLKRPDEGSIVPGTGETATQAVYRHVRNLFKVPLLVGLVTALLFSLPISAPTFLIAIAIFGVFAYAPYRLLLWRVRFRWSAVVTLTGLWIGVLSLAYLSGNYVVDRVTTNKEHPAYWLALATEKEAGNQSLLGRVAVITSILNRVRDPAFPSSVEKVVTAGTNRGVYCDYSFYCDGLSDTPDDQVSWKENRVLALSIWAIYKLSGWYPDPTFGAHSYIARTAELSDWHKKLEYFTTIDDHAFYGDRKT